MSELTFLLAGLPQSGKTTYLAALFHLLRRQIDNEAGLRLEALPLERDYLMEAESVWLRFDPLDRTVVPTPGRLTLPTTRGNVDVVLSIPDVRGEDFEQLWEFGTPTERLVAVSASAAGTLLVVRADDVTSSDFLNEEVDDRNIESFRLDDWDAEKAPTQTKLCDILEQLALLGRRVPIAVMVTAWDTAAKGETPAAWLDQSLPLLGQLLASSDSPYAVFAVSAQGGDVTDAREREKLARLPTTTARIADPKVRRGDDLTAPLAWLLDQQQ